MYNKITVECRNPSLIEGSTPTLRETRVVLFFSVAIHLLLKGVLRHTLAEALPVEIKSQSISY